MQASEGVKMSGHVVIEQVRDGQLIDRREFDNLIVTVGKAWIAGALSGDAATPNTMKYIGIGTGTGDPAAGDTALGTPVETRATGTQSRVTTTTTNDTYQCVGTITATDARAVTECGLFSADANGTMLARQKFAVMNLVATDTLQVTWKIKFA